MMNNRELSRQLQVLRNLFDKTKEFTERDMEIEIISHWAKYLCVLCAGFLENALTEVYVDFCSKTASPNVTSYARASLSRINNPNTETFYQVTNSFSKPWGDNLIIFVEENGRKEAINAIMSNRHKIAHGKNSDITLVRLRDYFKKAVDVVDFIEQQCN